MFSDNVKTALAILALLLIGFVMGFQTNRYLMEQHLKQIAASRVGPKLQDRLMKHLELDATQQEQVAPILKHYTEELTLVSQESRNKRSQLIDSMHNELKPLLTIEQQERLANFSERMKRMRKRKKMKNHRRKLNPDDKRESED